MVETQKKDLNKLKEVEVQLIVASSLTSSYQEKIKTFISNALKIKNIHLQVSINPDLLGAFQIKIGSTLLDFSVKRKLEQLQNVLSTLNLKQMNVKKFEEFLENLLHTQSMLPVVQKIGVVVSIKDGIVRVVGMKTVKAGELIEFPNQVKGIVFSFNTQYTDVVLLTPSEDLEEGDLAVQTGEVIQIPVGEKLIGRVVNALGEPIDDKGPVEGKYYKPLEAKVPGIIDRQPVFKPFQTGLKVVDALVPIGLGQRELIVGDRQTGKTSILIDSILNQKQINDTAKKKKDKIFCVYVCIGQKQSTVAEVVRVLQKTGAMKYTCVVCASASEVAALQYLAPFTGTTIGEYFRDNGMNAVLFYDDLSKHANAYRQISLLLRRPPGREAYPGDIFYLHSRLLERAAMMSEERGGGSLTALPVVETQEGDLSAYIPTNVISITDGQIFLENALFHQGVRPAVNVGLSVSRVGSKAQRALLAKMAGSMKLELAQYREMVSFAQIASDLDDSTQALLQKGMRITEVLKQPVHKPFPFALEYISLYAVVNGFYSQMKPEEIVKFEPIMLEKFSVAYKGIIQAIEETEKVLSDEVKKELDEALRDTISEYLHLNKGKN